MKTLKTFSNLAEAGFAHSLLEAAGLHPFLADEHTAGLYSPIMVLGIRLQIDESEYEQAMCILNDGLDAEPPSDEDGSNPWAGMATDPRASGRIPLGVFVAVGLGYLSLCYAIGNGARERDRSWPASAVGEHVTTSDHNKDGKADHFATYRNHKLVHAEADRNFDGKLDEWMFYESDGLLTRWETDDDYNGKPDHFVSYRSGKRIHADFDRNFDGKLDQWEFYGTDGVVERIEYDENHDGKPDYFTFYRNGKVARVESDRNFDGKIDLWEFYGADGSKERGEADENYDGTPDSFATYRAGNLVHSEADRNFDGKIDEWIFFDKNGLEERSEYDVNYDGKPDTWNESRDGERVAKRQDTDFNGVPDLFSTFQDGVLIQTDIRPNNSPAITRRKFFEYTILREEWVDEDADGKFDYRIEYDPFEKPAKHLPMAAEK